MACRPYNGWDGKREEFKQGSEKLETCLYFNGGVFFLPPKQLMQHTLTSLRPECADMGTQAQLHLETRNLQGTAPINSIKQTNVCF